MRISNYLNMFLSRCLFQRCNYVPVQDKVWLEIPIGLLRTKSGWRFPMGISNYLNMFLTGCVLQCCNYFPNPNKVRLEIPIGLLRKRSGWRCPWAAQNNVWMEMPCGQLQPDFVQSSNIIHRCNKHPVRGIITTFQQKSVQEHN